MAAEIIDWLEANYHYQVALREWQRVIVVSGRFTPDEWEAGDPADDILIPWIREHCRGRVVTRGIWMESWHLEAKRVIKGYFLYVEDGADLMNIKLRWC